MQEAKQPDPLLQARQLFKQDNYQRSKAILQTIKDSNANIQLNLFLTEHKINPANSDIVLKALMDTLTSINIKLFKDMSSLMRTQRVQKNPIKYISHEFYYWNIIIISQQIGKPSIASLMGYEALHFSSSFRTKTALMIIYEMLKQMACENRLAICGTLVMKFKQIFERAKKLNPEEEIYRAMNHIMWTKIFLRLGFLEESVTMYMEKLGKSQQQLFDQFSSVLPFQIYKEFLHAQIEYFKQNYKSSLSVLGQILISLENNAKIDKSSKQKIRNMVESNIGLVMMNMNKVVVGRKMILKANDYFRKICHEGIDNERFLIYERSKQLLFYSFLKSPERLLSKQDYTKAFYQIGRSDSNRSYKLFYRKAQLCVQYFHSLIRQQQSNLPYKQIVDNYECSYYYINDPYFQSKGKNKNLSYTQGKRYYRRYLLQEWDDKGSEQRKKENLQKNQDHSVLNVKTTEPNDLQPELINHQQAKNKTAESNEQKPQKKKRKASNAVNQKQKKNPKDLSEDENQNKKRTKSEPKDKQEQSKSIPFHRKEQQASQVAFKAITYFKQSLAFLQEQKKVILTFTVEEPHRDLSEPVNRKIYEDYRVFKQSILMNLCYLYLQRQNWAKVVQNAQTYRKFVAYDKQSTSYETQNIKKAHNQQEYYCILSYQLEAFCQLNKFSKAYQTMQDIIQLGYSENVKFEASSSLNLEPTDIYVEQTNQYHNLLFNIAVVHTKDNHLPEAHQALQKILSETNLLPNRSSLKTPLSVNDLLLHYHLRTGDRISGLQILKRRRVMGMGGVNGVYNVLKVTK